MTGHAFAVLFVAFVLALLAAMIVGLVLHAGMVPTLSGPL